MTAKDQRRLGEAIMLRRRRLGLRQQDLSERTGISQSYISGVERGLRPMNLDTLRRIAEGLDTTPAALLGDA